MTASEIIELLGSEQLLREGGYFKETYRSTLSTALKKEGPDRAALPSTIC